VKLAAFFLLALLSSSTAVSSLDASSHHVGATHRSQPPLTVFVLTNGGATLAGVALVP
jgi:hypothetical protein